MLVVQAVTLFGSSMWPAPVRGTKVKVDGMSQDAVVHDYGMLFYGNDGKSVSSTQNRPPQQKMLQASKTGVSANCVRSAVSDLFLSCLVLRALSSTLVSVILRAACRCKAFWLLRSST